MQHGQSEKRDPNLGVGYPIHDVAIPTLAENLQGLLAAASKIQTL